MSTYCGLVTTSGQITSNNNFSCQYDSNQKKYTVSYNGNVTNPVVVVSPTLQALGLTYMLYSYTSGFTMQVFQDVSGTQTPIASGFNFIVSEIV
jgi:hypothetical protein